MIVIKNVFVYVAVFFVTATTLLCTAFLPSSNASVNEEIATKDEVVHTVIQKENVRAVAYVKEQKKEEKYIPRLTKPNEDNSFYYSGDNPFYLSGYMMPNCTCYAWGRAREILKTEPKLSLSDAKDWYDYNKENGFYEYGEKVKVGAVACWEYENGGSGHVAIVEKVEGDTITYSNSAWSGEEFYINEGSVDNPDMYDGWIFEGYIYLT